jgi:plasmid stability protein
MKTTIDLPVSLVREMKIRAAHDGRKLKDVAEELLKLGLNSEKTSRTVPTATKGTIKLPLFPSPKTAPASRMSTKALLVLEQETLNQEDLRRLGLSV